MNDNNNDNVNNGIEIVAEKSGCAVALYLVLGIIIAILGVLMVVFAGDSGKDIAFGVFIILLAAGIVIYGIYILRLPKGLIAVSENKIILLKQKQEIPFSDIESIIPRRAHGRGISYEYGEIIIRTKNGAEFYQGSIADVEYVAGVLNKKLRKE